MALELQAFTTPANTQVIADTAGGTLPTAAVATAAALISPLVDDSNAYIWSPNAVANQTVTFRSTFDLGTLPILALALPVSVYFAHAANETSSVSATLEVVNLLGIIVLTVPLFVGSTSVDSQDVGIASADTLIAVSLLGNSARIVVDAVAVSSTDQGRYLGQITVRDFLL